MVPSTINKFSDELKFIREQKGFIQQEIADQLKVTKGAVSQWESGSTNPTSYKFNKLEEILQHKFKFPVEKKLEEEIPDKKGLKIILDKLEDIRKENRDLHHSQIILVQENSEYRLLVKRLKKLIIGMNLNDEISETIEDLARVSD